jgi:hypothetical protein
MNFPWLVHRPAAPLGLLGLLAGPSAVAQSPCPPVLRVLLNQHEVTSVGAAFAPHLTLRVQPDSACAPDTRYQVREAEVTLIRGRRPLLATQRVRTAEVDLTAFAPSAQPGDRLYIFVAYQNLYLIDATGHQRPYARAVLPPPTGLATPLTPDAARGISFTWILTK